MVTMTAVPPGGSRAGGTPASSADEQVPAGAPGSPGAAGGPRALEELLRASAGSDEEAFSELYDLTSSRVFGLVLRVVRDRAQAEEVLQESYLDVWRHSARYAPERGSALGWIMTIAHRKAVDRVRSAESETRRSDAWGTANAARDYDQTSEAVEQSLDRERVRRALGSLTDAQRGAIELAYFGGYTHTEVAGLLDLPLGTAKTRIRDGLIRLRDILGLQP